MSGYSAGSPSLIDRVRSTLSHKRFFASNMLPEAALIGRIKRRWWVLAGGLFVASIISLAVLQLEVTKIQQEALQVAQSRARLIDAHLQSHGRAVDAMAETVRETYLVAREDGTHLAALRDLRYDPTSGRFSLSGTSEDLAGPRAGSLTGAGPIGRVDARLRAEIAAALTLDGQLRALTVRGGELASAYYTSARSFIYLAAKSQPREFGFTDDLYGKEFWTRAVPTANPRLEKLITDLYEDKAGNGLMVTVSKPVVAEGTFLGVISVDLSIQSLRALLAVGSARGESVLVDENGRLVAKAGAFTLGERPTFDISRVGPMPQRTGSEWWSGQPLGDGHLLLHRLPISDVYLTAARNTLYIWALLGMVAILASVMVELRAAMAQVVRLTRTDPLTRVLNRRGFRESIAQMVTTGRRLNISWSVLMVDIDHFKCVNDRFGHEEGDRVIVAVADVLRESVREADLVCRWGGEEFAAFLFGTELEGACQLAERLRNRIEQAIKLPSSDPVTVSIGVTQATAHADFDVVLGTADRELYRAKATGRNRVCST